MMRVLTHGLLTKHPKVEPSSTNQIEQFIGGKNMVTLIKISGFRSEPSSKECLEAIWTQGNSCKGCSVTCYRAGWSKQRASVDNRKRVSVAISPKEEINMKIMGISELAIKSYLARKEYLEARKARAEARKTHECDGVDEGDPCWLHDRLWPIERWCPNCQFVQPYYLAIRATSIKSVAAKYKLNRAIKESLESGKGV